MKRKIKDDQLLEMYKKGMMQKDIAAHFGCSPVAVCRRIQRLLPQPMEVLDKYNLTDQQKQFVIEKVTGKTNTQAVMASYEVSSLQSAKVIGSQLMDKPEIEMAISELMTEAGLTKRYRLTKLKKHIDSNLPDVSLKGLDQSWRLDGSYKGSDADMYPTEVRIVIVNGPQDTLINQSEDESIGKPHNEV